MAKDLKASVDTRKKRIMLPKVATCDMTFDIAAGDRGHPSIARRSRTRAVFLVLKASEDQRLSSVLKQLIADSNKTPFRLLSTSMSSLGTSEEHPSLGGSATKTSSNWLTTKNSAARFAYRAFDGDSTSKTTDELIFVDELDAFVPRNKAPDPETCFEGSRKEKETFEMMLKDFAQSVESRKAFKRLGVEKAATCDLDYIFSLARAAVEQRDGTGNWKACKEFARKCFKSASKRDTALGAIISIIPSDVYGSLISGGVMTILAIANEHEKQREAVESAMADIPKKLDRVQRLSDVHVWSKRLHEKADGVLAAIFGVLQRIIDDMTMDRTAKFKSKLKFGSEDQVTGALSSLDDSISDFQIELDICAQFRMGRMHETINANGAKLSIIEKVVKGLSQDLNEGNVKAITKETIEEHVCNALHRFYASNPHFNPVNGGLKEPLPKRRQGDLEVRIPEQNSKIVEEWYESLQDFDPSPEKHVIECMRAGLGRLTLEDREKSQWIMSTPEVSNWLRLDESNILGVRAENAPDGLYHPLSFTAALLTETLQRSTEFPVLSFFCGIRTNEKFDRVLCGPLAVLNSLNGQLLKHFSQRRPGVDLSLLQQENRRLMKKSVEKPKYAVKLFRGLLELLEDDDVVFIILDSWSRLLGNRIEADKVVKNLSQITKDFPHLAIKILVLDPLPADSIHELADSVLYVPDEIDGWKNDVSLSLLKASNERMVEDLKDARNRKRELDESDSETSDQDW